MSARKRHDRKVALAAAAVGAVLSASPAAAGLNGLLEWNYSHVSSESTGAGGNTKSDADAFSQRYSLMLDKSFFPNLRLAAGGIFSRETSDLTTNGTATDGKTTLLRPNATLTLNTALYTVGGGYSRRQEENSAGRVSSSLIGDDYHALFGWRPLQLPSIDFQFIRSDAYDSKRALSDTTTDRLLLGAKYQPVQSVEMRYQGSILATQDHLLETSAKQTTQTAKVTYTDDFLNKRISVLASYVYSNQESRVTATGNGSVEFSILPFAGLSSLSDTPTTGALDTNNALIDSNNTVSTGINLGVPPFGGNILPRNIGLDLFEPTEVNAVYLWIDRELPAAIASSFTWEVYTSRENVAGRPQEWELLASGIPATFGPLQNRFKIEFPQTRTRYLKVVVRPLTAAAAAAVPGFADSGRIQVTEMQATLTVSAAKADRNVKHASHVGNVYIRTKLTEKPLLYLDNSLFLAATGSPAVIRYTLTNGLSAEYRITDSMTVAGRIGREDIESPGEHLVAYVATASLRATPLRTVTQSLVYSGRRDQTAAGKALLTNSLFLSNSLELYRGVHLNASGGISRGESETGVTTTNYTMLGSLSLMPHRTLSVNLNYSYAGSRAAAKGSQSLPLQATQRADASLSWRPVPALYLFGSLGLLAREGKTDITRNYGLTWTPFPDGALQFSFSCSENAATMNDSIVRLLSPSVSWRISSRMTLDGSYVYSRSSSASESGASSIYNANFKFFF